MDSRNEYLQVIGENYLRARIRKEKTKLLDEYCRNTGQSRKYIMCEIHRAILEPKRRKKREEIYDVQVTAALAKIWEIFDDPCGQRVKPLLDAEVYGKRTPFQWKGLDSNNGSEFINQMLYKCCRREGLEFARSRANRKNDNA